MAGDEQDQAEALDSDKLEGGDFPSDRYQGANQYGITAAEEAWDEPLEERISREVPDEPVRHDRRPPVLVAPDEGGIFDDEAEAIALDESADDLGALAEDDGFSGDPSLREESSERGQGGSAEEAAMHIEGDGDPLPDDLP
jgi:hypothetical protein